MVVWRDWIEKFAGMVWVMLGVVCGVAEVWCFVVCVLGLWIYVCIREVRDNRREWL